MEPLSLIGSIAGILTVAGKITCVLTDFIGREQGAPASARSIITEVSHLRLRLKQIYPSLQGKGRAPMARKAAIPIESVVVINTTCVTTLSDLEKILDSFKLDQPMSTKDKFRWARQEPQITTYCPHLPCSRSEEFPESHFDSSDLVSGCRSVELIPGLST